MENTGTKDSITTIGITGSSGFIGSNLAAFLEKRGYRVIPLKRNFTPDQVKQCDVIVNLAGASINRRWSKSAKKIILESRVNTTRRLTEMINITSKTIHLISASAIGIYSKSMVHTEESKDYDMGFLAEVCKQWEKQAMNIQSDNPLTIARIALVLDYHGGVLPKIAIPARMGFATIMGKGNQPVSWISLEDLINAIEYIIINKIVGTVNLSSPEPTDNKRLTLFIRQRYKAPFVIRIPSVIIKMFLGESASIILKGERVIGQRLIDNGFSFAHRELGPNGFK
jgi:uncharacterized protein (TIGR01777 family)